MTIVDPAVETPPRVDRRYYRDEDVVEEELRRIFAKSWLILGHESEISEPGDYVSRRMGRDQVIVARSESGEINVLLNSCTHRGTQVCKAAAGNSATFICGYHGWLFGNDGRLRGVPGRTTLYGPGFDLAEHGLRRARVEVRHGMIFATWDQQAPELQEYLGGIDWYLQALWDFFPGGMEIYGGVHRVVVRGNWKLHVDNFAGDGYHLRTAHRTMFELAVMGEQAKPTDGWVVNDPHGHSLRIQHIQDAEVGGTVLGHPEELLTDAFKVASEDQKALRCGVSVIHGSLFPNTVLITAAPEQFGSDASGQTAFYQVRQIIPVDAHSHEVLYYSLVPKDAPEEWKKKSYLFCTRQHGGASFFEADDLENFRRIDAGVSGLEGDDAPFNYELGIGAQQGPPPPWNGPGNIMRQDFTEFNQRNFIRRYLQIMEGGVER